MLENQNINFWFLLFFRGKVEIKVIIKIRKSGLKGSIMFSGRQKLKRNFVLPYTTRANIYISISPVLPINSQKIATRSVGEQSRPSGNGGGVSLVFLMRCLLASYSSNKQNSHAWSFRGWRDDDYLILQ